MIRSGWLENVKTISWLVPLCEGCGEPYQVLLWSGSILLPPPKAFALRWPPAGRRCWLHDVVCLGVLVEPRESIAKVTYSRTGCLMASCNVRHYQGCQSCSLVQVLHSLSRSSLSFGTYRMCCSHRTQRQKSWGLHSRKRQRSASLRLKGCFFRCIPLKHSPHLKTVQQGTGFNDGDFIQVPCHLDGRPRLLCCNCNEPQGHYFKDVKFGLRDFGGFGYMSVPVLLAALTTTCVTPSPNVRSLSCQFGWRPLGCRDRLR